MHDALLIGWAEESITPDRKVSLDGQFFERISEYVETPITATAMAVESGSDQLVICSCDLLYIDTGLLGMVRGRVRSEDIGLDTDKIIINATHVHTAMVYETKSDTYGSALDVLSSFLPKDSQYTAKASSDDVLDPHEALLFLAERISAAIIQAWKARKKAYHANGFGRAPVGMCRRAVYKDGSARMWGDTDSLDFMNLEGGNDSGIELLYIFDGQKKLTGVVANIACPAQVVEHRSFISSDYWGKVRILLREHFNSSLYVLGLCSAAGDQCPRDLIRWVGPETPIDDPNISRENHTERNADTSMFDINGTWKVGKRIADEIADVYEKAVSHICDDMALVHKVMIFDLPVRTVTGSEYEIAKDQITGYISKAGRSGFDFADNAQMHVYAGTAARYGYQKDHGYFPVEVHVVRFSDIAFATNPFELFLDYGNIIRARSRAKQTFIIQLACGNGLYLPTEKAEAGSHYSAYVSSGITGHEGGEILVRKTVLEINRMWNIGGNT
ncbi:MAG: hypothetical protein WCY62_00075 [Clostridia bacterium]